MGRGGRRSGILPRDYVAHGSFAPPAPGAITAFGTTLVTGAADISGVYALSATGLTQVSATASPGIGYPVAASGLSTTSGAATAGAGAAVVAAGLTQVSGASTGPAVGAQLTAAGTTQTVGAATATSAAGLVATGLTQTDGGASAGGNPTYPILATGLTQTDGASNVTALYAATAAGTTQTTGAASQTLTAAVAATGSTQTTGSAAASKDAAVAASGLVQVTGAASFGASQLPPSDALMTLLWHSELGIGLTSGDVQTWTDQLQGVVVSAAGAANRPAYGADGTNFQSRNVVQLNKSGPKYLLVTGASGFPLSGTRPYIVTGFRYRSLASGGSTDSVWAFYENTTARIFARLVDLGGGSLDFKLRYPTSATELDITPSSVGTAVSIHECWGDGTLLHSRVDGVDTTLSSSATLAANLNSVYFGYTGAGLFQTNATLAYVLVFSAKPSDPYIATLRAWSAAYFGTPP